jgi:hypothetical protein
MGGRDVSPRSLETMIDDAARELAANETRRDAEMVALRAAVMLVIATLERFDQTASQRIARTLMAGAASRRSRQADGADEPIATAMDRLADDLLYRLPKLALSADDGLEPDMSGQTAERSLG